MGGVPALPARGIGPGSRGTGHRITTPAPPVAPAPKPPQEYPPFAVETLGLGGATDIPLALAYALKWQIEFLATPSPPDDVARDLADKLIAIWKYLVEQEITSPRDPDGTLLVRDPWKALGHPKGKVTMREVAWNQSVPVAEMEAEPFDPWAPSIFPDALPKALRDRYPVRPKKLEEIPPFFPDLVRRWVIVQAYRPPPAPPAPRRASGKFDSLAPLDDTPQSKEKDPKQVQASLDRANAAIQRLNLAVAQGVATRGATPLVNRTVGTLKKVTLADIQLQTQVEFPKTWADRPLYGDTELILYHSVYSFVLDRNGEPTTLGGRLDYPILVPEPGSQMRRHAPPPGMVAVSVQKYGFQNFGIVDGRIVKLLEGGVGGFEEYGYGYSGPHAYHQLIQRYIDGIGSHAYLSGITAPAALRRADITYDRITSRLPYFVEFVVPPLVKEMEKRAKDKVENWQEFVKQIAVEVIKSIIIDAAKDYVRKYIIKKVGTRIVPGLNAAMAVYDLATGGTERMRMRNAIACLLVAIESDADEDLTIAGKVCAQIVADALEDKIIAAIVRLGTKAATAAGKHVAAKARGGGGFDLKIPGEDDPGDLTESNQNGKPAVQPAEGDDPGATPKRTPAAPDTPAKQGDANAPAPNNLSLNGGKGGEAGATPAAKPPPKTTDEAADRAVADMQQKIRDELRAKAEEAVRQSRAPGDEDAAAKKKAGKSAAAGTSDDGTHDPAAAATGVDDDARATGARISAEAPATASAPPDAEAATGGGGARGSGGAAGGGGGNGGGANSGSGSGRGRGRRRTYPPRPPRGPPPADAGTRENPKRIPPQPDPVLPNVGVKEDKTPPEDFQDVRTQLNPPTASRGDVEMARAGRDAIGEPIPPGHAPHHGVEKRGGGKAGESNRETLRNSGVSVNDPTAQTAARGADNDAIGGRANTRQDTLADHTKQHGEKNQRALEKRLGTVDGDDDAVRGVLRDTSNIRGDGRKEDDPDFWLYPRSGRDTGEDKPSKSGVKTQEARDKDQGKDRGKKDDEDE